MPRKKLPEPCKRDIYTRGFLKAAGIEPTEENVQEYRRFLWRNNRTGIDAGLRLNAQGLKFVKERCNLKVYEIPLPKKYKVTLRIFLWLDRKVQSPYYVSRRSITVMHELAAFEIYKLVGDVKRYGVRRALATRATQKSDFL